ncbi:MAG: DUF4230 domain-containing protein [Bacteroidaceae bacterium]
MKRHTLLLLLLLPLLLSCREEPPSAEEIARHIAQHPITYTETYIISRNIIKEYKDKEGHSSKAIIPLKAKFTAQLNLKETRQIVVNKEEKMVWINLPKPEIALQFSEQTTSNSIYCSDVSRSNFFETELDTYKNEGRAIILKAILTKDIPLKLQKDAAMTLATLMGEPGFKQLNYTIEVKKYREKDLLKLIVEK